MKPITVGDNQNLNLNSICTFDILNLSNLFPIQMIEDETIRDVMLHESVADSQSQNGVNGITVKTEKSNKRRN